MQRIGIIGLGAMGRPMARHLIAKGYAVCGYDPAVSAREQAAALGVSIVASPAEVARASDLVLIVVGFDAQVEKVFFGEQGLLAGSRAGLIVAMGSTIAPSYARRLAERVKSHGLILLDMALTRGEPAAEAGEMLILGGGDKVVFETCRPVFSAFASDIFNLGPFGAGQVGKMVNNLILWSCMAANDEGLRLGEALGVDQETMRAALVHSSAQNWSMSARAESRPTPWAEKDMTIVQHEADGVRLSLPVCGLVKEVIKDFKRRRGYPTPSVDVG
jgi:3-hydroxyisobutyrate dehydrogenase-like beta-hydroxyacid dehydrogenase